MIKFSMGYFNGLTNPSFNKVSGKTAWYPWGIFAPGYLVSSQQEYEAKKLTRNYTVISMIVIFLVIISDLYLWSIIYLIISSLYFWYKVIKITEGSKRVKDPRTYLQFIQQQSKAMGYKTTLAMFISTGLITLVSFFGLVSGIHNFWYILCVFLFSLLTIYAGLLYKYSIYQPINLEV